MSHLSQLANPLDLLLDLFTSIHIPNDQTQSQVETTLGILTTLMNSYDSTFIALQKARDEIAQLDSRHILNQQRLTEFSTSTSDALQKTRSKVLQLNQEFKHLQSEKHILRHRLTSLEKERRTQDELILNMANKLNETEEQNLRLCREKKKLELQVVQLKSHMQGMQLWKNNQDSIMREPRIPKTSARSRALAYAESQEIKKIVSNSS